MEVHHTLRILFQVDEEPEELHVNVNIWSPNGLQRDDYRERSQIAILCTRVNKLREGTLMCPSSSTGMTMVHELSCGGDCTGLLTIPKMQTNLGLKQIRPCASDIWGNSPYFFCPFCDMLGKKF